MYRETKAVHALGPDAMKRLIGGFFSPDLFRKIIDVSDPPEHRRQRITCSSARPY
jgi:hypothetical protein